MSTGTDNRGLYLKALIDAYIATVAEPKGVNMDRTTILKILGKAILGDMKEAGDANYTILDTDGYNSITFTALSADRTCALPTVADNIGRLIYVHRISGTAGKNVIVTCESGESINGITDGTVVITEDNGWWAFLGTSAGWRAFTDGNSSKVEFISQSDVAVTATKNTWYNPTSHQITIPAGKWKVVYQVCIYGSSTSATLEYVRATLSTANNSESDINNTCLSYIRNSHAAATFGLYAQFSREVEFDLATEDTFYLNIYHNTDGTGATLSMTGSASTTFIKAWRTA